MKKIIFYLPRALSVLTVIFFGIFIFEGFGPDFTWKDSLMHLFLVLMILFLVVFSWKKQKIGGLIFLIIGFRYFFSAFSSKSPFLFVLSFVFGLIGILFLIEGFLKSKKNNL